jgi:hypothetical protein
MTGPKSPKSPPVGVDGEGVLEKDGDAVAVEDGYEDAPGESEGRLEGLMDGDVDGDGDLEGEELGIAEVEADADGAGTSKLNPEHGA